MQWFLVKHAGSNGCIYDFSRAEVMNTDQLRKMLKGYHQNPDTAFIEYGTFDTRIGLHSWHLMGDTKEYGFQHVCWIYSQHEDRPYLSEDFDLYFTQKELDEEKARNIPFKR